VILAGDVGGTKCNLALVEKRDQALRIVLLQRYVSRDYERFEEIIAAFLSEAQEAIAASAAHKILAAGFCVAGPVIHDKVQLTNLTWSVDATSLRRQLDTAHVILLNDLEATGYSLPWLAPSDFCTLNAGTPAAGATQALIAAGTGLGEAILRWSGGRTIVEPGEGGHCDLAPRTEKEIELLRYMKRTNKYVSCEMILSGRGFLSVHQFLNPAVRHPSFDQPGADPAPEITHLGLEGSCPVCVETLDLWTGLYGAEAGNLALKAFAVGGMFVAGGIVTKILPKVKDGTFFRAFCEKSKFENLLRQVAIQAVLNEEAPVLGSAAEAARILSEQRR
jgi:glucokinase